MDRRRFLGRDLRSRLDGSDATPEDMGMDAMVGLVGMLGAIVDETGVGVNDAVFHVLVMAALRWMTTPSC